MTREVLPHMRSVRGDAIVNISSIGAFSGTGRSGYGASKAGVIALSRDIAVQYGREGIRANAIAPRHMATPLVAHLDAETLDPRRKIAPLGMEGTA